MWGELRFRQKWRFRFAYVPSVQKVPSFVKADDEIKPTTKIVAARYAAYKKVGLSNY